MSGHPTQHEFVEGSETREYDLFEELPDGSTVWRSCVVGMKNAEISLQQLTEESNNRFFAIHLYDRSQSVLYPSRAVTEDDRQAN